MRKRTLCYFTGLTLALCLYFFENNTGTRAVLCCTLLFPLLPFLRKMFFVPDQAMTSGQQPITVRAFSYSEAEGSSDVRVYQQGDPVNRMHWKLSAKRNKLLVRKTDFETIPEEISTEVSTPENGKNAGHHRRNRILFCLSAMFILLLSLFLIPDARLGAQALCNRLFDASEQVNAYLYERFNVPTDQSVILASMIMILTLMLLIAITLLSGSRLLAFFFAAGCALFQMYYGLSFRPWLSILLFTFFALWMMNRPLNFRKVLFLLATVLAVSLAIMLVYPGISATTETASERVRDSLSRMAQQMTETVREVPEGENETRHTHTRSLTEGERESDPQKEYRLKTVEEEQISKPEWINYLKIVLLLLAAILLMILPFLPFMWLNARKKKAQEARKAFSSANISEAICAIFQHVTAWLEAMNLGAGNLPYRDWVKYLPDGMQPGYDERFRQCAALFEEAAYSNHGMQETQRQQAFSLLSETEQAMLARADWKQKLRLKYGDCLWIEKA